MTVDPPRWTTEQLEADRLKAIEVFRVERLKEPLQTYLKAFDDYRRTVEDLFESTADLTELPGEAVYVLTDPTLLETVRYLAGPPISADDLKTLAEVESLAAGRLRMNPEMARRVVHTVVLALDLRRFPWIAENREPSENEREAAALASAALMASERVQTNRRSESKKMQGQAVEDRLVANGFEQVRAPQEVKTLQAAPGGGQFCRETQFGSRKADIVIGLGDERKMPCECKVSNSATNSIKRLNNDASVKARTWISEFGTLSVVPAAVLSGVYKLSHLMSAQASGLTIFWAHDLDAMTDWVETTRS